MEYFKASIRNKNKIIKFEKKTNELNKEQVTSFQKYQFNILLAVAKIYE